MAVAPLHRQPPAVVRRPGPSAAAEAAGWLRARLRDRPDTEHEQAFTRLVVVPAMFAYMLWAPHPPGGERTVVLLSAAIFAFGLLSGLAIIAHILWRPAANPARRIASMAVDVGGVGAGMLVGGAASTVFFPILLWIILGYGFRFGRPYLFAAAGMSVAAFATVLLLSAEWRAMPYVDTALMLSLVLLPAYFSVLLRRLTDAIQSAEEASRAKSHFVAAVSHEFRTPLNAVLGMSDLLRTTRLSRDQDDMVATIRAAATGLLGLVDNVLDLAKLEARRFTVDEAPLDLHQVLATVRHLLSHAAAAKGLYLRQRLAPGVPYRLRGDGRAVQQVLLNLVGNAVKFTERGGIVVEVELVEPSGAGDAGGGAAPSPARLRFEVRDTGLGLSPAAQAQIFERFAQADETRRRVIGGTGLGLSIARELVEVMGGAMGVTSAQGRGSRFWFELPLAAGGAGDAYEEPARGQVAVLGGRASATAAVGRLDRLGWRGRAVASVEAALQLAQQGGGEAPLRAVLVTAHDPPVDVGRLAAELARRAGGEPVDIVTLGAGLGELPELTLADLPEDAGDEALLACLRAAHQAPAGGRPPADEEEGVGAAAATGGGGEDGRPRTSPSRRLRILVAEDNRTNQKVIGRLLEHAGHEVSIASDGQGAVDALEDGGFDVVLMDINMPDMDGIETVKLLRFLHRPEDLPPIVALSADATAETQAACREVGFSGYLTKPIDTKALLRALDRLVAGDGAPPPPPTDAAEPGGGPAGAAAGEGRGRPGPRAEPALDPAKFASIARLDAGDGFLAQVIDEFVADAAGLVGRIEAAVRAGDARAVRDEAHALRSSAGYIGAAAVFALCMSWRGLDDDALIMRGRAEMASLREEFERLRQALEAARPSAEAGAAAPARPEPGHGRA